MRFEHILTLDARYSARIRIAEKPGFLRKISALLAHSGDSWFWILGLGLLWWCGTSLWIERATTMGIGVVITALVVLAIKFTVRRSRPEGEWGNIYRSTDPHSFPSGHAARAAMLAVLAIGLGPAWFAILLVLWAPSVGLARVAMGVHYLSDIVAGTTLGAIMGVLILKLM